jgi:hypothetical protein
MIPDIGNIREAKVSDRRGFDDFRYPKDTIIVDHGGYFDTKLSETISNPILVAESTDFVINRRIKIESPVVELSTILAEMTDEDLQQMATMYKNDLFLGEFPH